MSSETSIEIHGEGPAAPVAGGVESSDALQPWQLFTLAGLIGATAVVFVSRGQTPSGIILLSLIIFTAAIVGVATWLAFRAVGLEQAEIWGLAAGVFNSIPYFGPVIVAAGTFVVGFLQFSTIGMGTYVAGISLIITTLEGWLLTPWLTSRTARTNEVAMFIGLIFWSFVWGLWGTLLAVPMLVAVKACCDRIEDLKPIGELLGE